MLVAGPGTEPAVLHLVDCSLLSPPRPGLDGRTRYLVPETIRAFGAGRLADAGERPEAAAALASYALAVAEQASAGMRTREVLAAVRWLDAEDATTHQAVAWAMEHDPDMALRLAVALAEWWLLRGRVEAGRDLLLAAVRHAAPGSQQWCLAQFWIGDIGPVANSVGHEIAACEVLAAQPPTPLLAELLAGRSRTLMFLGRIPEAIDDARLGLDVARQIGYPAGEVLALAQLSRTAHYAGDAAAALDWARQAQQILASGELGWIMRFTGPFIIEVLIESGDLAAARRSLTDSLAWAHETGAELWQASALTQLADVELRGGNLAGSGRHLREATEIAPRVGPLSRQIRFLDLFAYLCVARGPVGRGGDGLGRVPGGTGS